MQTEGDLIGQQSPRSVLHEALKCSTLLGLLLVLRAPHARKASPFLGAAGLASEITRTFGPLLLSGWSPKAGDFPGVFTQEAVRADHQ